MVMTVLKVYFKKKGPSIIQYGKYKNFSNDKFRNELNERIRSKIESSRLDIFVSAVLKVLSKNPPIKKRYIRANEAPFMNKVLKKAVMKSSQLRNVFRKKNWKVKLYIINKGSTASASYGKKNETTLKTLTLKNF